MVKEGSRIGYAVELSRSDLSHENLKECFIGTR